MRVNYTEGTSLNYALGHLESTRLIPRINKRTPRERREGVDPNLSGRAGLIGPDSRRIQGMNTMTSWESWAWLMVELAKTGEPTGTGDQMGDETLFEIHRAALADGNRSLAKAAWAATSLAPDAG